MSRAKIQVASWNKGFNIIIIIIITIIKYSKTDNDIITFDMYE